MKTPEETARLLRWELRAEWRDRFGLGSVLLYVIATVVIVYFAARELLEAGGGGAELFNAFYWITVFFGATVACGRSFLREGGRRHLYYYTLASPEALLVSKLAFNFVLLVAIAGLTWALLGFFTGVAYVIAPAYFLGAIALGCAGLSAILTFVAALAARAGGSGTLMAVLSFPLVIPLLYVLTVAGAHATDTASVGSPRTPLVLAAAIDLLAVAAGLVLFPFVWRD